MPIALGGAVLPTALVAWNSVVVPGLPRRPGVYAGTNLAATAALLGAARRAGLGAEEVGLATRAVPAGARLGGWAATAVVGWYALVLALPATRPLLADARVSGLSARRLAVEALVEVPLGTVVWEEVAFRGVLLAALRRLLPDRPAVVGSALVFGLWHVRPTLDALEVNGLAPGAAARTGAVTAAAAATAVAGVLFAELRLRSGSLLAPALLHLSTNSLGVLAGAAAQPSSDT